VSWSLNSWVAVGLGAVGLKVAVPVNFWSRWAHRTSAENVRFLTGVQRGDQAEHRYVEVRVAAFAAASLLLLGEDQLGSMQPHADACPREMRVAESCRGTDNHTSFARSSAGSGRMRDARPRSG
jgi:hypothetical protein